MTRIAEFHIVGTALKRTIVLHFEGSEGFPSHQTVGKLKGTVFD